MIAVNRNLCPHDHLCPLIAICPVGAISQGEDGYPIVNHDICIECGLCVKKCPMKAMEHIPEPTTEEPKTDKVMKIAVPTRDNRVDDHFGHCDHYTIFTIEDNHIVSCEELASPQGCGCKSGIAAELQRIGVGVMLAGNMGEGAKSKLEAHGINVVRGCTGAVQAVVEGYLAGAILDSGRGCAGHDGEHQCSGGHHGHSHGCKH